MAVPGRRITELCDMRLANGGRCQNYAKWSVLASHDEYVVCGVHRRMAADDHRTMAMEPLDAR
jgi:hypothetical protein